MITDLHAAELCQALYRTPEIFFHYDGGDDDGICWAISQEKENDVIVLRGSVTPEDWMRDTWASPYLGHRRNLGPVHHGFYQGMDNAWDDIKPFLRPMAPVVVTGHSLGAARAALLAAIMLDVGKPPVARVVFGEPKPGFQQLADFLNPIPTRSYRCGDGTNHDPIPNLPWAIPPLNYRRQTSLTDVVAQADPNDYGPFVFHHMGLYLEALVNQGTENGIKQAENCIGP